MKTYQVQTAHQQDGRVGYTMTNGESVVVYANGSSRCLNVHSRGLADSGRFAHVCQAMRAAVRKFVIAQVAA